MFSPILENLSKQHSNGLVEKNSFERFDKDFLQGQKIILKNRYIQSKGKTLLLDESKDSFEKHLNVRNLLLKAKYVVLFDTDLLWI